MKTIIITIDRKVLAIGILCVTAALALSALLWSPRPASADFAVKDRDYQIVTTPSSTGSDAVYVVDNKTGLVVVFLWDNARRALVPATAEDLTKAFQ